MRINVDGSIVLSLTATLAMILPSAACATSLQSPADRIQARAQAAKIIIGDPQRAAEAEAALEAMHGSVTEFEASVSKTRVDLLAMHHDPSTTPEAFRAAIKAMRERHEPMLLELIDQRMRVAASTTEREWNRLQKQ